MGHVISERGIEPDSNKVRAIADMPLPIDKQGVKWFCGMVNYLNHFSPNMSGVIKPLFDLSRQNHEFIWSDTHQLAFTTAKCLIAGAPCLAYFNTNKAITLQVDASQYGLGAVLMQPNESGTLQPVAFTSCKCVTMKSYGPRLKKNAWR